MEHRHIWNGKHRGVAFEVHRWQLGHRDCWNYYLHIPVDQLPEDMRATFNLRGINFQFTPDSRKSMRYEYGSATIISDLDWHGGITFYEKHRDVWGKVDGYKLGCDFAHYCDEGMEYDLETVGREARRSIDKLYECIPNLKLCCTWDGRYYPANEGELNANGNFRADINKDKDTLSKATGE